MLIVEAIILETAVGPSQKVQDFEPESFAMGAEHSQKVKAAPIASDSGSKDCAFGPAPTAVSRIICLQFFSVNLMQKLVQSIS
jgi:hypothetical protein